MSVRLIAGRAGSGKTHYCLSEIRRELEASRTDGPRLVLLVPEQAGLQMERALLSSLAPPALGRCEVLSFRRLAHRIFNEAAGPSPRPLTAIGRQMALRHLIGRYRRRLREFSKVADRGGFLSALSAGIVELIQEAVTPEQLAAAALAAESDGDPSAARLTDMAVLYQAYLDYLGSERVDPEGVLDLARARLERLTWPTGARIWIDGFAGLTQQQIRMIVALARQAAGLEVALLLDPSMRRVRDLDEAPDDLSLFARTERTWFALARALREAGVAMEAPLVFGEKRLPRFSAAPALEELERRLFAVPTSGQRGEKDEPGASGQGAAGVTLIRADDRRQEVEAAATAIVDLVQRPDSPLRYRDIAVVVRDLTPYHDLISAALAARKIPFFIDRRRPTFHHPLVQFVRALLGMHGEGPFDQSAILLLKTGLTGLEDFACAALENYVLAHGLVSEELWEAEWKFPVRADQSKREAAAEAGQALAAVNRSRAQILERLGDWRARRGVGSKRMPCSEWVRRLVEAMERFDVRGALQRWCEAAASQGNMDEAEEHEQVWADLAKLLDEAAEALGDEQMTGRPFREVIESGLAEFTLGLVPATIDQVLVSSIERSRHPPVRAVFVMGFGEGQFPARLSEDAIFGDDHRARLEQSGVPLASTRRWQLLDERMLAYIAFTRPSEFHWVSYPEADEAGKPLAASPYWAALCAAAPGARIQDASQWLRRRTGWPTSAAGISHVGALAAGLSAAMRAWCEERIEPSEAAYWHALYEWASKTESVRPAAAAALAALGRPIEASLTSVARAALWKKPYRISVTALEQYAACPFKHFSEYGLKLEPRAVHEVSALDMGRIYHEVLEQYVNELCEKGQSLGEVDAGEIASSLSRICRFVVPKYAEEVRMEEGRQRGTIRRGERELATAKIGEQAALGAAALRTVATEKAFGMSGPGALPALVLKLAKGETVEVRGKIDRLDVLSAGDSRLAVVFDYKRTIGKTLRLDEAYHGLALQLLAYLLVVQDYAAKLAGGKLTPGGAFYLPLIAGYERVDHPSEVKDDASRALKPYRPRGVVDFDWITAFDPSIGSGWSRALSVYRTKEGALGNIESSDAVNAGKLPALLEHVREKMTELVSRWLAGEISVRPALYGSWAPCEACRYRGVCRMEYATRKVRKLDRMKRSEVLARVEVKRE